MTKKSACPVEFNLVRGTTCQQREQNHNNKKPQLFGNKRAKEDRTNIPPASTDRIGNLQRTTVFVNMSVSHTILPPLLWKKKPMNGFERRATLKELQFERTAIEH
jgi:hypothetical protein